MSAQAAIATAELNIPPTLSFLAPGVVDDLIRVGKENDGGYVVPASSVEMANTLISFGICDDWSFEEHFKKLNAQIRIHAYDHTISGTGFGLSVIRGMLKLPFGKTSPKNLSYRWNRFSSYNRFFAGETQHFAKRVSGRRDDRGENITPAIAFQRAASHRVFLKIDIEGDEYQIIDDLILFADRIVGMVVEFHQTANNRSQFIKMIQSLQNIFEIVHFHANNFAPVGPDQLPESLELTFVKRAVLLPSSKRQYLPLAELDSPNNPRKPDYQIRFSS